MVTSTSNTWLEFLRAESIFFDSSPEYILHPPASTAAAWLPGMSGRAVKADEQKGVNCPLGEGTLANQIMSQLTSRQHET